MAYSYDSRFVSHSNHSLNSLRGAADVRPLPVRPGYQHVQLPMAPATHFDYTPSIPQFFSHHQPFVPTLEFSVPLLHSLPDYASELQSISSIIRPALPSWYQHVHVGRAIPDMDDPALCTLEPASSSAVQPPLLAAASTLAGSSSSMSLVQGNAMHDSPHTAFMEAISLPQHSSTAPSVYTEPEPCPLQLEDVVHVKPSSPAREPNPPPIFAQNSPDILSRSRSVRSTTEPASHAEPTAYSECPSADFLTPIWSSSSTPPLSFDCSSESESTLLTSSQKVSFGDLLHLTPSPLLLPKTEELTPKLPCSPGIYVDVNMLADALHDLPEQMCIDPTEIMTDSLKMYCPSPSPDLGAEASPSTMSPNLTPSEASVDTAASKQPLSPAPEHTLNFPDETPVNQAFEDEAISAIVSVLKSSVVKTESLDESAAAPSTSATALPPHAFANPPEVVAPRPMYPSQLSSISGDHLGITAATASEDNSTSFATPAGARMPLADINAPQSQYVSSSYSGYASTAYPAAPSYTFAQPGLSYPSAEAPHAPPPVPAQDIVPVSPVLNAHAGVELEDLRRRATDFRARNPGVELDKSFLQCFAGRLSARGELLEDYRCYVVGCEQRNKRRDHILVHVGSHVEHRPWACRHWCVNFAFGICWSGRRGSNVFAP